MGESPAHFTALHGGDHGEEPARNGRNGRPCGARPRCHNEAEDCNGHSCGPHASPQRERTLDFTIEWDAADENTTRFAHIRSSERCIHRRRETSGPGTARPLGRHVEAVDEHISGSRLPDTMQIGGSAPDT